jgi:WD40 repeat protein
MAAQVSFDTQHADMIHDSSMDYYSRKLATASSDRTVKVWDVHGESYNHAATLTGHDGCVFIFRALSIFFPGFRCGWEQPGSAARFLFPPRPNSLLCFSRSISLS